LFRTGHVPMIFIADSVSTLIFAQTDFFRTVCLR
jgi:hypothetical protein